MKVGEAGNSVSVNIFDFGKVVLHESYNPSYFSWVLLYYFLSRKEFFKGSQQVSQMHWDELKNHQELKLGFQGSAYVMMKVPTKIKYVTLFKPVQTVFQSYGTKMNCLQIAWTKCLLKKTGFHLCVLLVIPPQSMDCTNCKYCYMRYRQMSCGKLSVSSEWKCWRE